MAEKKAAPALERVYTVPLRKEYRKVPRWRRTKKAVKAMQQFVGKHMKTDAVKLDSDLNKEMWKHGAKNPPHKVKITVTKDDKGVATASLFGAKKEAPKADKKGKKVAKEEVKVEEKPVEKKAEEKPVETKEAAKKKPESKEESA